jgi:DNA-binding response OmpR family regulator
MRLLLVEDEEKVVRFKALLRRGQVNHSNSIRIAGLEIDRINHQVKRNGITIKLTAKEYSLLEYLAVNTGRVLSRTMIVEHIWDQSFEGLTNIVDVYIRQLPGTAATPRVQSENQGFYQPPRDPQFNTARDQ